MDRSARRFRFSLAAHEAADRPRTFTPEGWRELARKTEALGYCTLHVADHYLDRGRAPQFLAPIAAMATAAAVTTTLRIGSRVFCIDYHVPAALAKEAATLDYLSEGRLELGLGAGWSQVEYESMGLVFEAPPRRISRLEEVVALMKAHFSGEEMDCRGRSVHVGGYKGLPPPVQQPRPRLMIGGGKKRVLSLAAREADIVSFSNTPFAPRNETGQTPHDVAVERLGFVESAAGNRLARPRDREPPYSRRSPTTGASRRPRSGSSPTASVSRRRACASIRTCWSAPSRRSWSACSSDASTTGCTTSRSPSPRRMPSP
ncbi:MAG: LLM class flavin-dependent oxidoreductase [Myxococcota bacterium]